MAVHHKAPGAPETIPRARRRRQNFSRSFLRSEKFLLQKCAILCNALQTLFVRLTYDLQCCATQRKRGQKLFLELQISRSEPTELTLSIVTVRVGNDARAPARIHGCNAAPTPTGFAGVCDVGPPLFRTERQLFRADITRICKSTIFFRLLTNRYVMIFSLRLPGV
jgi:hypothetical protein